MPHAPRSLLLLLLSVSACFRVGESPTGSAAPALSPTEESTVATRERDAQPSVLARTHAPAPRLAPAQPVLSDEPDAQAPAPREVIDTVELQGHATVRAEARLDAPALGMVSIGGRVDVYERVDAPGCRTDWLAIAPRGYICARTQRTRRDADGILPEVPEGRRVPGIYGKVAKDAVVYADLAAAARGQGRAPGRHLTVRQQRSVSSQSQTYWKTPYGLIDQGDVERLDGSPFHGEMLEDGLARPLAWTLTPPRSRTVDVRVEPHPEAEVVQRLPGRRARVVLDERSGFVRVDEGWIALDHVRVARRTAPPTEVGERERWLDIDLSQQVLVAYEGPTPVYATLVSSGRPGHRTPTGVFRISRKVAERTMNSMADSAESYSVDKVPWTAYFATGYALHAAFWHGGFGRTRSHGCVNLAPYDARALYDWMAPAAAPGWSEVYGHEDQPGSLVRLRSHKDPHPELKGYARDLHQASAPTLVAQAPGHGDGLRAR